MVSFSRTVWFRCLLVWPGLPRAAGGPPPPQLILSGIDNVWFRCLAWPAQLWDSPLRISVPFLDEMIMLSFDQADR